MLQSHRDFDSGSFRDPDGRMFHHGGAVYRTIKESRLEELTNFVTSGPFLDLVSTGHVMPTTVVLSEEIGLDPRRYGKVLLKQQRVPFVSYPNEWSFEMLRQAAICTLDILKRSLDCGYILKDATTFNVVFEGSVPKLVDILSFVPYKSGAPWHSYGQFCRSFLYPLLISSYRRIDVRPWLLTQLLEIAPSEAIRFFSPRDFARPGVFKDIFLAAKFDSVSSKAAASVQKQPIFATDLIRNNVARLADIIQHLESPYRNGTEWSEYAENTSYSDNGLAAKKDFVAKALCDAKPSCLLDIGANSGEYSRIGLEAGVPRVLSIDSDPGAIDRLFKSLTNREPIYPIVANLAEPTPATGWALKARPSLLDRIKSDYFIALAVIHHLRISGCIPFELILDQLAEIAPAGIIEWVEPSDPMVLTLLALRDSDYPDFNYETFINLVKDRFEIVNELVLKEGMRRLLRVVRRR